LTGEPTAAELDFLLARVEAAIAQEKGVFAWLRSMPTRLRIVLAGSATGAMAAALGLASPRVDLAVYPQWRLLLSAGVLAAVLGGLIVLNLRPLQRPELSMRAPLFVFAALAVPFLIALLPEVRLAHPVAFRDAHDCLLLGSLSGALLMVLLRALDRLKSDARSLLVPAAAGGILANFALSFHCPVVSPLHLVLIHAPIGVVLLFASTGLRSAGLRVARARRG
jgi:hypothetical protein